MDIILHKDKVYGRQLFYPANSFAEMLCKLMGKKTMDHKQVKLCRDFGFNVVLITQEEITQ